jgi:hypothetical protein
MHTDWTTEVWSASDSCKIFLSKLLSTWNAASLQSSTKEELLQAMNLQQKTCNKLQKKLAA